MNIISFSSIHLKIGSTWTLVSFNIVKHRFTLGMHVKNNQLLEKLHLGLMDHLLTLV